MVVVQFRGVSNSEAQEPGPLFKEIYYRNNRRGGQKNLRCFPHCGPEHNPHGYCGNSVVVEYSGPIAYKNLFVFAKFEPAERSGDIRGNERVQKIFFLNNLRNVKNPLAEWMEGKKDFSAKKEEKLFVINARQNCWHYGWLKNQGKNSHQLKVFFMASIDEENFLCVETLSSSSFEVASTRRKDAPGRAKSKDSVIGSFHLQLPASLSVLSTEPSSLDYALLGSDSPSVHEEALELPGTSAVLPLSIPVDQFNSDNNFLKSTPRTPPLDNDRSFSSSSYSNLSPDFNPTKKRKKSYHPKEIDLEADSSKSRLIEIARNLAILRKCASEKNIYSSLMSKLFIHLTRDEFIGKIQLFMKRHSFAVTKKDLLTNAYAELLVTIQNEVDCCLKIEDLDIDTLVDSIKRNCSFSDSDVNSMLFPFGVSNSATSDMSGFLDFISQMRTALMIFSGNCPFLDSTSLANCHPTNMDGKLILPINGKFQCLKATSTFYTEAKPSICNNQLIYEELLESAFEVVNFRFDGVNLQTRSEKSFLPNTFAKYELEGNPSFTYITFMGATSNLSGQGGYIGKLGERKVNGRKLLYPMLSQYHNVVEGSKVTRKRVTSSILVNPLDRALLTIHLKYEKNEDQETMTPEMLQMMDTRQKVLYPATWNCVGERFLSYKLVEDLPYLGIG